MRDNPEHQIDLRQIVTSGTISLRAIMVGKLLQLTYRFLDITLQCFVGPPVSVLTATFVPRNTPRWTVFLEPLPRYSPICISLILLQFIR